MILTSPQGIAYLERVRLAVRAVVEYGSTEDAANALQMTVEALEALRASVYGRAFQEWTYGDARPHLRHRFAHELAGIGFTPAAIQRVFGDVTAREVTGWLETELPAVDPEPEPTRYTGRPCIRCGRVERYSANHRCVVCAYAIVQRGRDKGGAGIGVRV